MLRRAMIFVTALALFVITVSFVEFLVPKVLGIDGPDPTLLSDPAALELYMRRQPASAFLGIAVAHLLGAVVAGLVLGLGRLPVLAAWILGGIATLLGLLNLLQLPGHPVWFWVLDLAVYVPGVLLGHAWVSRTREVVEQRAAVR